MSAPKTIVCENIELRAITPRYAQELYQLARDPELSRYLQWPAHQSVDDSLEFIHDAKQLNATGKHWIQGVFLRDSGTLIGTTGLNAIDRANRHGEVGTWIGIPHQNKGYNLAAKAAVAHASFTFFDLNRIEFQVATVNEQSARAMRKLPALRDEGVLAQRIVIKETPHDAHMFALLRDEYDRNAWPAVQS